MVGPVVQYEGRTAILEETLSKETQSLAMFPVL
jgi:hypothetical protein